PRRRIALQHLVLVLPDLVEKHVPQDRQQPGPAVRARVESVKAAECAQHRFLDDVFRLDAAACQPKGCPVEQVEMDERRLLELAACCEPRFPGDQMASWIPPTPR